MTGLLSASKEAISAWRLSFKLWVDFPVDVHVYMIFRLVKNKEKVVLELLRVFAIRYCLPVTILRQISNIVAVAKRIK